MSSFLFTHILAGRTLREPPPPHTHTAPPNPPPADPGVNQTAPGALPSD